MEDHDHDMYILLSETWTLLLIYVFLLPRRLQTNHDNLGFLETVQSCYCTAGSGPTVKSMVNIMVIDLDNRQPSLLLNLWSWYTVNYITSNAMNVQCEFTSVVYFLEELCNCGGCTSRLWQEKILMPCELWSSSHTNCLCHHQSCSIDAYLALTLRLT